MKVSLDTFYYVVTDDGVEYACCDYTNDFPEEIKGEALAVREAIEKFLNKLYCLGYEEY